jgi:hypothetical protein
LKGIVNGKLYRGWDYLREKWFIATKNNPEIVYPKFNSNIKSEDIINILKDQDGNISLSDVEGRVKLLNDLGKRMLDSEYNSVQDIYDDCKGYIVTENDDGLLKLLSQYKAYSDPVRKKSLYFLSLMNNNKLWEFKDISHLGTPVDYHEIRGHLRLGSIKINDNELWENIKSNKQITKEDDIDIRQAVFSAIMHLSSETGYSASKLHYFFWNLFRNCCDRINPHCTKCHDGCSLPKRYGDIRNQLSKDSCLLSDICLGEKLDIKVIEPKVITEFY